ncbi:flagellar hook-basal body complex protein [Clostridium vincentii]|uniref:Flagellar basal-body rod protein FlgG n=1 Tax=Clostridium vincentii TaxID=52704 RepID=A0A2T0BJ82_9CLOT|nr:flagellar hook-basal body complex protein [Clostridium vincentii]PRR83958.1 Flagellar basal-body rod protein FlgG [Clostridium vincentii]
MFTTLSTSKSGLNAQQTKLDTIGNNLANSTTVGYKRVDVGFQDLLNQSLNRQGIPTLNEDISMGTGVRTSDAFRDNTQGSFTESGVTTDLAIEGQGYFKVTQADGSEVYTRDGAFKIDRLAKVVDGRGNKLEIEYVEGRSEENCNFTTDNLLVDSDGSVYIKENGAVNKVGEIPVYSALGDSSFASIGDNLFVPTAGSNVERTANVIIHQGLLEGSNVDITTEFTDMIVTQRAFQLCAKGVTTADEMWGMVNNMRR